nr:MAG TPA: hypothetical protein [Caudoviricetes sp.]
MCIQFNFPLNFSCIYLLTTFLAERGFLIPKLIPI